MRYGYARVSTTDQDLAGQVAALQAAGCGWIFEDRASGMRSARDRAGLGKLLSKLQAGDVLVVWALDRLGRSLPDLVLLLDELRSLEVEFVSLREAIDTGSAAGRLQLHMLAALAAFERERISERTRAGLQAAKARGRVGGRPPRLAGERLEHARTLLAAGRPPGEVAHLMRVSRSTLWRALQRTEP